MAELDSFTRQLRASPEGRQACYVSGSQAVGAPSERFRAAPSQVPIPRNGTALLALVRQRHSGGVRGVAAAFHTRQSAAGHLPAALSTRNTPLPISSCPR